MPITCRHFMDSRACLHHPAGDSTFQTHDEEQVVKYQCTNMMVLKGQINQLTMPITCRHFTDSRACLHQPAGYSTLQTHDEEQVVKYQCTNMMDFQYFENSMHRHLLKFLQCLDIITSDCWNAKNNGGNSCMNHSSVQLNNQNAQIVVFSRFSKHHHCTKKLDFSGLHVQYAQTMIILCQ